MSISYYNYKFKGYKIIEYRIVDDLQVNIVIFTIILNNNKIFLAI